MKISQSARDAAELGKEVERLKTAYAAYNEMDLAKILLEYRDFALKGGIPNVQSPHYALAGMFEWTVAALAAAEARGRREGLEMAAKVCAAMAHNAMLEMMVIRYGDEACEHASGLLEAAESHIRALTQATPQPPPA